MTLERNTDYLIGLFQELRKLPKETEWIEFKGGFNYQAPHPASSRG